MNEAQEEECNVKIGVDYPFPIIKLSKPPPVERKIKVKKVRWNRVIRPKKMKRKGPYV
jgi:hypothetical protein